MPQNFITMKKQLVKEGILLGIVVVALAGGAFLLQIFADDAAMEKQNTQNEVSSVGVKLAELRREMENGRNQETLFTLFGKSHNSKFDLNRETATNWIVKQKDIYHLMDMSITIPPFVDIPKETFSIKSDTLVRSDVKLTFSSLTDNTTFAFIEKLQRDMPGVVVISDVKITKTQNLNSAVLLNLRDHKLSPLVSTELMFSWIGIKNNAKITKDK